jgi:hypothetical protein
VKENVSAGPSGITGIARAPSNPDVSGRRVSDEASRTLDAPDDPIAMKNTPQCRGT